MRYNLKLQFGWDQVVTYTNISKTTLDRLFRQVKASNTIVTIKQVRAIK